MRGVTGCRQQSETRQQLHSPLLLSCHYRVGRVSTGLGQKPRVSPVQTETRTSKNNWRDRLRLRPPPSTTTLSPTGFYLSPGSDAGLPSVPIPGGLPPPTPPSFPTQLSLLGRGRDDVRNETESCRGIRKEEDGSEDCPFGDYI